MNRSIVVVGAPSSIGIRPYEDGGVRRLDLAPSVLREHDLLSRLGARDAGDVLPAAYRDVVRPPRRPRNEQEVATYSLELARRVHEVSDGDAFVLLLGGDCSIVLGALLGIKRSKRGRVGLAYVDAHGDFATPEVSRTGSAASMCLALAVGRGDTPLARLGGDEPLVREEDVVVIGRRDDADEPWYDREAYRTAAMLDIPDDVVRRRGPDTAAQVALERLARPEVDGFWIHVDADVLDPAVLPAVDSPAPGGLALDELASLLMPLVAHPRALGLELTIYDPGLDPDRSSAARLATLLERVLGGATPPLPRTEALAEHLARGSA